jgi:hypothetical protein
MTLDNQGSLKVNTASNANAISLSFATASVNRASISLASSSSDLVIKSEDTGGRTAGIQLWTGNASAERMRIDSSGNVGIGNTAANVNDQVGAVRPLLVSKSDSATTIAGSQAAIVIGNSDTTTSNTSQLSFAAITGANTTFFTSAAINCVFGARTNGQYPTGQLVFSTSTTLNAAPTEKMRIDSSGNVGIGTSSPIRKLTVSTAGSPEFVLQDTTQAANSRNWRMFTTSNSLVVGRLNDAGSSGSDSLTINPSGDVGIGTSSPAEFLHLNKASGDLAQRFQTSAGNCYVVNRAATSAMDLLNAMNGPMTFSTNNAERMRIDSSGNLLVGTTTSSAKFNVIYSGDVSYFETSGSTATCSYFKVPGTTAYYALFQNSSGTNIGSIRTTDGTTVQYNTSSDYRLKDNVAPMTGALARVAALKPCTYTWKSTGQASQGFIAHELQAVVPECVSGAKDAIDENGKPIHQGVDTSFLVATLTAAIQEQQALIASLTARIVALEST